MDIKLGRIEHASFGRGGYQDAMIGLTVSLSSAEGWGCADFWGAWGIKRSEHAKWSEESRIQQLGDVVMRVNQLLNDAKVSDVSKLKGVPVEVTFDGMTLKSWRVLSEVL